MGVEGREKGYSNEREGKRVNNAPFVSIHVYKKKEGGETKGWVGGRENNSR